MDILHDIIEKISMNSYTQYEIRVMLEELAKSQEQQQSPFVEEGLLAIPEEHIFDNLSEDWTTSIRDKGKTYLVNTADILDHEKPMDTVKRLGLKPIGE